jgi:acyl carrier protein
MAEQVENVKEQIREFVQEAAQRKGVSRVTDDQSLVESGVIDSLGIFRLVAFLEESFRVRIGDEEIVGENFESIVSIEQFVQKKLSR